MLGSGVVRNSVLLCCYVLFSLLLCTSMICADARLLFSHALALTPHRLPAPSTPPPQFFLTIGTIFLGAYVAVKVFGVDVAGITGSGSYGGGSSGGSSGRSGGSSRPSEWDGCAGGVA